MFCHIRASRQLILGLTENALKSRKDDHNHRLLELVLEVYSYLVLTNNITPFGAIEGRNLPYDSILTRLGGINYFGTSGVIFGGSHGLFEMLPSIGKLSSRRLTEQHRQRPSHQSLEMYNALHDQLARWEPPEPESSDPLWLLQRRTFLSVCHDSVSIYLEMAMSCSTIDDPLIHHKIQAYLDAIMLKLKTLSNSPFETVLLWPMLIAGSCMVCADQRESLRVALRSNRFQMKHSFQAAALLESVWWDPDERIYGPYGLSVMMKKYDINIGMA